MHRFISIARLLAATTILVFVAHDASAQDIVSCANVPAEAAIPFCTRAIESGRYDGRELAGLYLNRGLRYAYIKDKQRALSDYTKAIETDPDFPKPYNNRGSLYFEQFNDYDRALDDYNEAIEVDPKYVIAYNGRAEVYSARGDYENAIADFNDALNLSPQYTLAYFNRSFTYIRMKDYAKALADANQAVRLEPRAWQPLWARGIAHFAGGKLDLAIADYNAAIQINAKFAEPLYARGLAKLRKGDDAGGNADIAAAKAIKAEVAEEWLKRTKILPGGAQDETVGTQQAATPPQATAQQSAPHAESCNNDSWGFLAFHGYEFGTVNSCEEEITIWFRKKGGGLRKATVKSRGVFTTGYDMDTYAGKIIPWISATCRAGYEPNPRVSFKNQKAFDDSTYKCVATR